MKATRSYVARPDLKGTEHRLEAVIDGVRYAVAYVITLIQYAGLDPADASKIIESYLWTSLMNTIEHNLRKNLTHA